MSRKDNNDDKLNQEYFQTESRNNNQQSSDKYTKEELSSLSGIQNQEKSFDKSIRSNSGSKVNNNHNSAAKPQNNIKFNTNEAYSSYDARNRVSDGNPKLINNTEFTSK